MASYVDVADIRQHMREAGAFDDALIEEYMTEEQTYVRTYLRLDDLPADSDLLRSIIRDLTVARLILNLTAANSDNYAKGSSIRSEALRRLRMVRDDGMLRDSYSARTSASSEVFNPYPEPLFTYDMFRP